MVVQINERKAESTQKNWIFSKQLDNIEKKIFSN